VDSCLQLINTLLILIITLQDSPPPEPTPTPPPQPAAAPPRQVRAISSHQANGFTPDRPANININAANMQHPSRAAPTAHSIANLQSYNPSHLESYRQTPASSGTVLPQFQNSQGYGGPAPAFTPQLAPTAHSGYASSHHQSQPSMRGAQQVQPAGYKAPKPSEVYYLPDAATASIPEHIRDQFQFDSQNRLILFTTPPNHEPSKPRLAHSAEYLAFKAKQMKEKLLGKKRRAEEEVNEMDAVKRRRLADPEAAEAAYYAKVLDIPDERIVNKDDNMLRSTQEIQHEIRHHFEERMQQGNVNTYKALFPEDKEPEGEWNRQMKADEARTALAQADRRHKNDDIEKQQAQWEKEKRERNKLVGQTRMLDYVPPNEHLEWGRNP
jgi:hypothetical protein